MSNLPGASSPSADAELIARAKCGDLRAFDQLVLQHQQTVFAVALRMLGSRDEAQDIAQDAFVRAFRGLGSFRQEAKLSTWLVSITMNLCRNRRRWWMRRRRVIVASLDDSGNGDERALKDEIADLAPSPALLAERSDQKRVIMAALQTLDEEDRMVIVLRDIQGYAYEEIAEALGWPLGTVKSRLSRARLQLRARLDGTL